MAEKLTCTENLPLVLQPTLSIKMDGHIRCQIPCSPEAQAIFDLLPPELKVDPSKSAAILECANNLGEQGVEMIKRSLAVSPQLKATSDKFGASFAVVDGKLFYMLMLPVRSA